ncbi:tyrosine-type recombinase/integrase [Altererythrobacter sp. TH136]|uniref:tyrosine-type recombinase/integrase n=1 Tax=Altererythrobacter sp. TH136 TaxID=2067415 RepID=UPI001162A30F|nr:tyrosine-type recombinase/integrase [Altererythrobacter sp. TH136]QDM40619.1 tyrosine-type recombinase/integrase [Altererythrobacter sp. TH136]
MGLYIMHILKHRSGRRSFRRVIPEELRPFCGGKTELKVSLGQEGSQGFHSRYEAAAQAYEVMIATAQRKLDGAFDALDPPRIAYLAELFRSQSLEEDDLARYDLGERELYQNVCADLEARGAPAANWSGDPVRRWSEKARETTEMMLAVYRDLRAIGDHEGLRSLWEDEAGYLIEASDLVVDTSQVEAMGLLYRALNDAAISVCEDKLRRLDGDHVPTPTEPTPVAELDRAAPAHKRSLSLLTIYDGYAAAQGLSPGVRDEWRRYIERLIQFLGHDDATRLTPEKLMEWRDDLLAQPSRKGTSRDPVTVRDKYITSVRAALAWAVEERMLHANPATGVIVRTPRKARLRDPDFTAQEAKAILSATLAPASPRVAASHARARRWIPWLCAYTGARVNEFSQLRKEDVQRVDGIWTVRITPEAGTVKTKEARVVPLHEHLIEQGFLTMVEAQSEGPLFYEPERQRVEGDSNRHFKKVGERLAEWVRKEVGITDPGIKPNHAWRHTFKSISYSAGIEERVVDAIQGHSPKTTGRRYGKPSVKALAEAIAKVPRFEVGALGSVPTRPEPPLAALSSSRGSGSS